MHDSFARLLNAYRAAVPEERRADRELVELGIRLQASPQTLTNWKRRGVSKEGALKAEEIFGCSPAFILEGVDQPPASTEGVGGAAGSTALSVGDVATLLAEALDAMPDADRDLVAQQIAHLVRRGPNVRLASSIDALAPVDVSLPAQKSAVRQVGIPPMGEFVDLDQQVLDTVRHLARLSHTMTSPQRRAMVAALQGTKETSWDSTDEGSRKFIEREREMNLGPRQQKQLPKKAGRS